jgi:hypothetical protein
MKHKTSAALYEYWLSCHADRAVRAGGISALALAPLLPDIFLLDLNSSENCHFRYCGAAIALRYGRDLTGESFLALWSPPDRRSLTRDLRAMASPSTGMVAGVMGETMGGGFIAYEMLLLPLVGEHGGAGALGSMLRIGGHEEQNRIRGRIVAQALRSTRFLPAAESGAGGVCPTLPQTAVPAPRRYGHLTVVSGGK